MYRYTPFVFFPQVPAISCEFAQQLEFRGEHDQALSMYTAGLNAAQAMASRFDTQVRIERERDR